MIVTRLLFENHARLFNIPKFTSRSLKSQYSSLASLKAGQAQTKLRTPTNTDGVAMMKSSKPVSSIQTLLYPSLRYWRQVPLQMRNLWFAFNLGGLMLALYPPFSTDRWIRCVHSNKVGPNHSGFRTTASPTRGPSNWDFGGNDNHVHCMTQISWPF